MTEYTRPATREDVKTLARHLEEEGVEYALVGGYADEMDRAVITAALERLGG